jgi:hypothetical protein
LGSRPPRRANVGTLTPTSCQRGGWPRPSNPHVVPSWGTDPTPCHRQFNPATPAPAVPPWSILAPHRATVGPDVLPWPSGGLSTGLDPDLEPPRLAIEGRIAPAGGHRRDWSQPASPADGPSHGLGSPGANPHVAPPSEQAYARTIAGSAWRSMFFSARSILVILAEHLRLPVSPRRTALSIHCAVDPPPTDNSPHHDKEDPPPSLQRCPGPRRS